jgi:large subunit ribosomal protein L16
MLTPKKTKYRRHHRLRSDLKGTAIKGTTVAFGTYALKAVGKGELNSRQIEAARRAMTRSIKRGGKIWIRVFPHKIITRKSAEVPMGSGKGAPDHFCAPIRPGVVIFELQGVTGEVAKEAMLKAAQKLPFKCKYIDTSII